MYHRIKFFLLSSLACFTAVFMASAQKQPQDTLTFERSWSHGLNLYTSGTDHYGIAVDISNRAWIVNGSGIYVFTADTGTALTNWAVANARALRFDSVSNLFFVCSRQNTSPQVRIYKPSYTLITQWGTNSLSDPSGIAVDLNGSVFIADYGNSRINVFNRKGDYQSQFSVSTSPTDVAVTPDDFVYVSGNYFVGCYSSAGTFVSSRYIASSGYFFAARSVAASSDGLLHFLGYYSSSWYDGRVVGETLTDIVSGIVADGQPVGSCFSPGGDRLYVIGPAKVYVYRRCYRTVGARPLNALPLPYIQNTAQRSGTQWIDVDFSVADSDNATVQVGAIGFVNGQQDLLSAVPMKSFTNGTDIVSWTNVTTGVQHHITWDALTDWFALYGNLKVNILAKDNRNLLDFHLITIPSNATSATPLTISVSPYGQTDFLGIWTWLIATRDPSINLSTGNVYAVGNLYGVTNQALLAQTQTGGGQVTTLTTSDGRTFLYSMISSNMVSTSYSNMIVREATTNEIYRAAMGTVLTNLTAITQWPPLVQINGLPVKVNEYGFDTGTIGNGGTLPNNAWWVVLVPKGP